METATPGGYSKLMPRTSRISIVESKVTNIEQAASVAATKVVELDEKFTKFLSNDWAHAEARSVATSVKVSLILAVVGLVVLGIFVPLAVRFWSNWLS